LSYFLIFMIIHDLNSFFGFDFDYRTKTSRCAFTHVISIMIIITDCDVLESYKINHD
jgi:hypothetical protein